MSLAPSPKAMHSSRRRPNRSSIFCIPTGFPACGGKPVGMQKMLERFGLRREECMAFGDGANDIEMLQYAGLGIAMGNGDDEVKRAADYVTDAVDADGIVNALRHFGLL